MPWRHIPPDWYARLIEWLIGQTDEILLYLSLLASATLGTLTKVAAEVRDGEREKLLSSRLMLDLPAALMMASISYGIAEYAELTSGVAGAVGVALGYLGPRAAYLLINALADRIRGGGK